MSPYSPARLRASSQSSTSSAFGISPDRHDDSPMRPSLCSREVLAVDPRLVVVAVDVGVGDEPAQVPVADEVLGEQDQVEGLGVGLALLVGHRPAGDVGLDPDDRLDALGPRRLVEGDGAVERAVVGDRHRIHAQLRRRIDQLGDPAEAVEQAEFGVDVEVREVVRGDGRHGTSMVALRRGDAVRRHRPRLACRRRSRRTVSVKWCALAARRRRRALRRFEGVETTPITC